jgi:hypothetical protein
MYIFLVSNNRRNENVCKWAFSLGTGSIELKIVHFINVIIIIIILATSEHNT